MIGETIDENRIEAMSLPAYNDHIRSGIREAAFKNLTTIQATYKKVIDIKYDELDI